MLIESPGAPPRLLPDPTAPLTKKRWWQRKHSDAEILCRAVGVIDDRGWTTDSWQDSLGRVCLLGAVGVAVLEAQGVKDARAIDVMDAADKVVGLRARQLSYWNDTLLWAEGMNREMAASRVKDKLRSMAREAEKHGKYPRLTPEEEK